MIVFLIFNVNADIRSTSSEKCAQVNKVLDRIVDVNSNVVYKSLLVFIFMMDTIVLQGFVIIRNTVKEPTVRIFDIYL